jgi:hypothetical protein
MRRAISRRQYRKKKNELYRFISSLYRFLRLNPESVKFEKIHGNVVGYYDYDTEEITLDYRKDIIPTLVHEYLHHLHSKWSETKIIAREKEIMSVLTAKQCRTILKNLVFSF